MMTTRILPPEEWPRLVGTELEDVWPLLHPQAIAIVVVEDAGQIVGTWVRQLCVHVHGLWIHPAYRKSGDVFEALGTGMTEAARQVGASAAFTTAPTDGIRRYLERRGAEATTLHLVPLQAIQDRKRGHAFHVSLAAHGDSPTHPDDPEHDQAVGAALRLAFDEHRPDEARDGYNVWAWRHGYERIQAIDRSADEIRVEFESMTLQLGADGHVRGVLCLR